MAPRGTRRQHYVDEYSEESDTSSYKRHRRDKNKEDSTESSEKSQTHIDESEYKEAFEALKKQRDDNLLLIKTEHEMRLESATRLAKFEEQRLNSFFEHEVEELKKKILEERAQSSKRSNGEGSRKRRLLSPRTQESSHGNKKEDVTLTVELPDNEIVQDVCYMVKEWIDLSKKQNQQIANIVVILPGNRLLVNEFFIEPNTECYMQTGNEEIHGQFISADEKEFMFKPDKEKRKKYVVDGLRDGSIVLSYSSMNAQTTEENTTIASEQTTSVNTDAIIS